MIAALLTIVLFAAPSEAVSRVHFVKAQRAFSQHEWRRALDEFTAASEAAPTELPDLWFDIGQCHRNLGHARLAVAAFERYLVLKPEASDVAKVRGLIASLGGRPVVDEPPVDEPPPPPVVDKASVASVPVPAPPAVDRSPSASLALTSAPELVASSLPPAPAKPRRRWAVWTGVGVGVAVVALGVGLGVGLGTASVSAPSSPMLGSAGTFDTRHH